MSKILFNLQPLKDKKKHRTSQPDAFSTTILFFHSCPFGRFRLFLLLFWANKKVARTRKTTPIKAVSLPLVELTTLSLQIQTKYLKWSVLALFRLFQ